MTYPRSRYGTAVEVGMTVIAAVMLGVFLGAFVTGSRGGCSPAREPALVRP